MISSSFKVLQVNLNYSTLATESALQVAVELKVDLLVVQELQIVPRDPDQDSTSICSVLYPSFTQILLANLSFRPRTLVYMARSFCLLVSLTASSPQDPDLLVVDIIEGKSQIQLLNIYNEDSQLDSGPRTLKRVLYSYTLPPSFLLLGDFNTHYPQQDPLASTT